MEGHGPIGSRDGSPQAADGRPGRGRHPPRRRPRRARPRHHARRERARRRPSTCASEVIEPALPWTGGRPPRRHHGRARRRQEQLHRGARHPPPASSATTVAVLSIDPSSTVSGGVILGDKTRMERLATDDRAFIRPVPSSGTSAAWPRRRASRCWSSKRPATRTSSSKPSASGRARRPSGHDRHVRCCCSWPARATNCRRSRRASPR